MGKPKQSCCDSGGSFALSLTSLAHLAREVLQYHVCYGNTQSPNLLPGQESRGAPQSPALLESILSPLQELSTFEAGPNLI